MKNKTFILIIGIWFGFLVGNYATSYGKIISRTITLWDILGSILLILSSSILGILLYKAFKNND